MWFCAVFITCVSAVSDFMLTEGNGNSPRVAASLPLVIDFDGSFMRYAHPITILKVQDVVSEAWMTRPYMANQLFGGIIISLVF